MCGFTENLRNVHSVHNDKVKKCIKKTNISTHALLCSNYTVILLLVIITNSINLFFKLVTKVKFPFKPLLSNITTSSEQKQ